MPANMVLIEKITVGAAGASSVTFSGIPQTGYTDLVVKVSARSTNGSSVESEWLGMYFNGSDANLSGIYLYGYDGTSTGSSTLTNSLIGAIPAAGWTANTFSNSEIYIPNYTSSNNKSYSADSVAENNSAINNELDLTARLWSSAAAITSITLVPRRDLFAQFSTFYLYGVAKLGTTPAIVPYATGGDTIETDGTYWYHAFLSSGTFTPQKGISCDVLVVAGGAGGATGGGGAGGVLAFSAQSLASNTNYTATIGAGGAGGTAAAQGSNGSNSQFASLTATVGGGGGGTANANGSAGGSGGAGGYLGGGATYPGAGTAGQGFDGSGNGNIAVPNYPAGGGGGAGAVGVAATTSIAGSGGAGLNTWSSWLSVIGLGVSGYIAGGGGGISANGTGSAGTGGAGGGGAGNNSLSGNGTSGIANTGSGGGATNAATPATAGAGGSGLVIIRYAV